MSNKIKLILIVLMLIILLVFEIFVRNKNRNSDLNEDKNLIKSELLTPTIKDNGPIMTQEEIEEVENNGGFTENINFDPPEN